MIFRYPQLRLFLVEAQLLSHKSCGKPRHAGLMRGGSHGWRVRCYPTEMQNTEHIKPAPRHTPQYCEKSSERHTPLRQVCDKAKQDISQQSGPYLPAHGVFAMTKEVGQLECLLEEHFDGPAPLVKVADGGGSQFFIVSQESHDFFLAVNFYNGHNQTWFCNRVYFRQTRTLPKG